MGTGLGLSRISKSFGSNRVLDGVSLTVAPGEFLSIVGPSGCGKSTLLRLIAGLEIQDDGEIEIGGANVDALSPRARNIAMVFQSYALYPHLTAYDNIALPLVVGSLSLAERLPLVKLLSPRRGRIVRGIAREVTAVARQLHIEPLLARKPVQLSGGQRQRVALARAMVRRPSLFLMDEPLSNLDAQLRIHMRDELADLHQRLGATFIYVTHDQVEAMTMSSRIAMLDHGTLAQVGSPRDLYERPATVAVARFIGAPTINVLPGRVEDGGRITLAGHPLALGARLPSGAGVSIGVRAEAIEVVDRAPSDRGLAARVRRIEFHGAERLAYVDLVSGTGTPMVVRLPGTDTAGIDIAPGSDVSLALDLRRLHVFDERGRRVEVEAATTSRIAHAEPILSHWPEAAAS